MKCNFRKLTLVDANIVSKIIKTYSNMKGRCYYKNNPSYKNYGGRGIKICSEWLYGAGGVTGEYLFIIWSIENGCKEDLTIDRIDVNDDYSPTNCRWVNMKFQDNNKRNCHYLTAKGKTQTITQWAEEVGVNTHCILNRLKKGWSDEAAIFTPRKRLGVKKKL